MKKKLMAVLATMAMAFSLMACGGGKAAEGSSGNAAAGNSGKETETAAPVTGETVDTGAFSVLVPEGWKYEVANSSSIKIYKGDIKEDNANIDLRMYNMDTLEDAINNMIDESEPIDDVKVGDITWKGSQGTYMLMDTMAVIGTDTPGYFIAFADMTGTKEVSESSYTLSDADVLAILGSITLTAE